MEWTHPGSRDIAEYDVSSGQQPNPASPSTGGLAFRILSAVRQLNLGAQSFPPSREGWGPFLESSPLEVNRQ
jgi:hypothetical protein